MRIVGKWNYETHRYDPYELPEGACCYSDDMDKAIACARCGREVLYGDCYTSRQIHTPGAAMGYAICGDCNEVERKLEEEYRKR